MDYSSLIVAGIVFIAAMYCLRVLRAKWRSVRRPAQQSCTQCSGHCQS